MIMKDTTTSAPKIRKMPLVDAVKTSMLKRNRVALLAGGILGGFVPIATFVVGHLDTKTIPMLWLLVAGGLIYSAMSVYDFAKQAFKSSLKSLGFVILIEGAMTFSTTECLSYAALGLLILINAVACGCNLALDAKDAMTKKR